MIGTTIKLFGDVRVVIEMAALDRQQSPVGTEPTYLTPRLLLLVLMTALAKWKVSGSSI